MKLGYSGGPSRSPRPSRTRARDDRPIPSRPRPGKSTPYDTPHTCSDPRSDARLVHQILSTWDREVMGAIYLDIRNRAIGHQLAYIGTLTRIAVEPRGILTAALLASAAGIILFYNYPSGDPPQR